MDVSQSTAAATATGSKNGVPGDVSKSSQVESGNRRVVPARTSSPVHAPLQSREAMAIAIPGQQEASLRSRQATIAGPTSGTPVPVTASGGQTRAPEPLATRAPRAGSPPPDAAEPTSGIEKRVKPNFVPASPGLPWLSTEQNAARETRDQALKQFADNLQFPQAAAKLNATLGDVRHLEEDIGRATRLLWKSEKEKLSGAEWRELYWLLQRNLIKLNGQWAENTHRIKHLMGLDIVNPPEDRTFFGLLLRLAVAQDYVSNFSSQWGGAGTHMNSSVPTGTDERVDVQHYPVPGTVLGAHFAQGYPPEEIRKGDLVARYSHVPDLSLTTLINRIGSCLFSAVCHAFVHANELDRHFLKQRSDEEVKALHAALSAESAGTVSGESFCAQVSGAIPKSRKLVALATQRMRRAACQSMENELVAAILLSYPQTLHLALNGVPSQIGFVSIALLTPGDVNAWKTQRGYFHEANVRPRRVEPAFLDARGRLRRASVSVKYHQFVLWATDERLDLGALGQVNEESAEWLFGSRRADELGGAVKASLAIQSERQQELEETITTLNIATADTEKRYGPGHPLTLAAGKRLLATTHVLETNKDQICMLEEAGRELKSIWLREGEWPAGVEEHRRVAALLALTCFLVGRKPLLSCAEGRGLTRQLVDDANFLAAAADNDVGRLPLDTLDEPEWQAARSAFAPLESRPGR